VKETKGNLSPRTLQDKEAKCLLCSVRSVSAPGDKREKDPHEKKKEKIALLPLLPSLHGVSLGIEIVRKKRRTKKAPVRSEDQEIGKERGRSTSDLSPTSTEPSSGRGESANRLPGRREESKERSSLRDGKREKGAGGNVAAELDGEKEGSRAGSQGIQGSRAIRQKWKKKEIEKLPGLPWLVKKKREKDRLPPSCPSIPNSETYT